MKGTAMPGGENDIWGQKDLEATIHHHFDTPNLLEFLNIY